MSDIVDSAGRASQGLTRLAASEAEVGPQTAPVRVAAKRREGHRALARVTQPQQERLEVEHLVAQVGVSGA